MADQLPRRSVLGGLVGVSTGFIAGCSAFDTDPVLRVVEVSVDNQRAYPIVVVFDELEPNPIPNRDDSPIEWEVFVPNQNRIETARKAIRATYSTRVRIFRLSENNRHQFYGHRQEFTVPTVDGDRIGWASIRITVTSEAVTVETTSIREA